MIKEISKKEISYYYFQQNTYPVYHAFVKKFERKNMTPINYDKPIVYGMNIKIKDLLKLALKENAKGSGILFVEGRISTHALHKKLEKFPGFPPNSLPIFSCDLIENMPKLDTKEGQELIEKSIGNRKLIIFDDLKTLFPSCILVPDNKFVKQWFSSLKERGISIILKY